MTASDPTNDSLEADLIADMLGIGAIDAVRVRQLILDAHYDPENSVLSLKVGAVVSEVVDQNGYRRIWEIFYSGFLIEVGELWDKRRQLLNIVPHPLN